MNTLTIFTPTFNRAHLLPRLYESLCCQSSRDFRWLVIDDGSTDGTRELVERWVAEGRIPIDYCYKPNGGMHTAHNVAYQSVQTEINTCIDSDDTVPPDAVRTIIGHWQRFRGEPLVGGIVGLDVDFDGRIIGTRLPPDGTRATLGELHSRYKVRGDKKLVYRSSVTRGAPRYPEYPGEKLVPLGWLYGLIDQEYQLVCVNQPFVSVEYQADGSSATVIRQYFQSPRGFRDARMVAILHAPDLATRVRNMVHYGVSSLILRDYGYIWRAPSRLLAIAAAPVSVAAYLTLLLVRHLSRAR